MKGDGCFKFSLNGKNLFSHCGNINVYKKISYKAVG